MVTGNKSYWFDCFAGVLGFNENAGGNDGETHQHCKHPLFLPENDTISKAFPHLPPLKCNKGTEKKCSYR